MALQPKSDGVRGGAPTEFNYRCPGCGELVDQRDLDRVRQHHRHVLTPPYPADVFHPRREASRIKENRGAADGTTRDTFKATRDSTEITRRRYGHN